MAARERQVSCARPVRVGGVLSILVRFRRMRRFDVYLQRARIRRATDRLRTGSHVLDIGCHRGELRDALVGKGCTYFGMDPEVVNHWIA